MDFLFPNRSFTRFADPNLTELSVLNFIHSGVVSDLFHLFIPVSEPKGSCEFSGLQFCQVLCYISSILIEAGFMVLYSVRKIRFPVPEVRVYRWTPRSSIDSFIPVNYGKN